MKTKKSGYLTKNFVYFLSSICSHTRNFNIVFISMTTEIQKLLKKRGLEQKN